MLELILVRHGETTLNREKMYRGLMDVPLSETGLRQAELLADCLKREEIAVMYSSPLRRAVQTAEPLANGLGIEAVTIANLTDMDFGEWQGRTVAEVNKYYPELYRDWRDTPEQVRITGGESLDDVTSRVIPFLEDAVVRCGEGKMVIVSHRVVLKVLICHLMRLNNTSFWNFKLDTAGITRFRIEGGRAVLTSFNDTAHLDGLGASLSDF
ncbi:MAG: histidine phosphatase family protein [Dehalococcoidales bacterium]|nr:histidine phosphatase family protein [Dehalococcoidales bacterium]